MPTGLYKWLNNWPVACQSHLSAKLELQINLLVQGLGHRRPKWYLNTLQED